MKNIRIFDIVMLAYTIGCIYMITQGDWIFWSTLLNIQIIIVLFPLFMGYGLQRGWRTIDQQGRIYISELNGTVIAYLANIAGYKVERDGSAISPTGTDAIIIPWWDIPRRWFGLHWQGHILAKPHWHKFTFFQLQEMVDTDTRVIYHLIETKEVLTDHIRWDETYSFILPNVATKDNVSVNVFFKGIIRPEIPSRMLNAGYYMIATAQILAVAKQLPPSKTFIQLEKLDNTNPTMGALTKAIDEINTVQGVNLPGSLKDEYGFSICGFTFQDVEHANTQLAIEVERALNEGMIADLERKATLINADAKAKSSIIEADAKAKTTVTIAEADKKKGLMEAEVIEKKSLAAAAGINSLEDDAAKEAYGLEHSKLTTYAKGGGQPSILVPPSNSPTS